MTVAPIIITIGGEPVAKGRPRATRRGMMYTPAKTRRYEAHGRLAAQLAMDGQPPIGTPCRAEITIDLPVPQSWPQKRWDAALRGDTRPTTRPDADNYIKSALDAINSIVIAEDSLAVEIHAKKKFGIAPKMVATIFPLNAASNRRMPT